MVCTARRRVSIQQAVSTRPTLSTVLTLRDRLRVLILIRVVQGSRAVGRLGNLTLSTNIITILVHTVKGALDIPLGRTLTTVKVAMQCPQQPRTPLASLSTRARRPTRGRTPARMPLRSSSGNQANSRHKTTMEIQSARRTLQRGRGPEPVLHHRTNLRTNSTNVPHKWGPNPGQPHPQIHPMESLLK